MRLYLAGPMRGINHFNFPAFAAATSKLRGDGHQILSPAEHDIEANPHWDPRSNNLAGLDMPGALAWDLTQVLDEKTDGVVLLPGWQQSQGAQVESRLARLLDKPVFEYINGNLVQVTGGHPDFHMLLAEIAALHDRKQADYGSTGDPFANVRASQEWGIPPWVGALVRLNDKVHRLKQFAQKGSLANESAEDSMLDIAVYALIALVLYREAS